MKSFKKIRNYYFGIYSISDDYEHKRLNKIIYYVCRFCYGVLHPKIFLNLFKNFFINSYNSILFLKSVLPLKQTIFSKDFHKNKKNVLGICLRGMEECFFQIWYIMVKKVYKNSNFLVLSMKQNKKINLLCKILGVKIFYFEDISKNKTIIPNDLKEKINNLVSERDFLSFNHNKINYGRIALSSYFRNIYSGKIDLNPENLKDIKNILTDFLTFEKPIESFLKKNNISYLISTEIFMEEYALIAKISCKEKIPFLRFETTYSDGEYMVSKVNLENFHDHGSSISESTFKSIKNKSSISQIITKNKEDFFKRYNRKESLFAKSNYNDSQALDNNQIIKSLNLDPNKKIGVIFSHILYDVIFAYGDGYFDNYYRWLGETIKIISTFKNTQWILKLHPSNMWRGEVKKQLINEYEEMRVIKEYVGEIPNNLKIIDQTIKILPNSLMSLADLGITVRGTSGIELATMGKKVITLGRGRYDKYKFTNFCDTLDEYKELLESFDLGNYEKFLRSDQVIENSNIFYYGLFFLRQIKIPYVKILPKKFIIPKKYDNLNYFYTREFDKGLKELQEYIYSENYDRYVNKIS